MNSFLDVCNVSSNILVSITYISILFAITLMNIFTIDPILKVPLSIIYTTILLQFYLPAQLDSQYTPENKNKLKYSLYSLSGLLIFLNIVLFRYTYGGGVQFMINTLIQTIPLVMGISLESFIKLPQLDVKVAIK